MLEANCHLRHSHWPEQNNTGRIWGLFGFHALLASHAAMSLGGAKHGVTESAERPGASGVFESSCRGDDE